MPELIGIAFHPEAPPQGHGIELSLGYALDENRPLYLSYAHLYAGAGKLLLQYGCYLLTGFRTRGQQKLETERNAILVPYSVTVAVAPPRLIKKRPGPLRVIGVRLYVLWVFGLFT